MIAFLTDEDFNGRIIRGLRRRLPVIDLVIATSDGLEGSPDPAVLEWAAHHNRVPLTHDQNTMTAHAIARIRAFQPMPGVIVVPSNVRIGDAIADLLLISLELEPTEIQNQIWYLPI